MHDSAEILREVHAALGRDQRVDFRRHPIVIRCERDGSLWYVFGVDAVINHLRATQE